MKHPFLLILCSIIVCSCCQEESFLKNTPVKFSNVQLTDDFWEPRLADLSEKTVPFCIDQCIKQTDRLDKFAMAGGLMEGTPQGRYYDDSDLYKTIEGASYSLKIKPDPVLESQLDSIIQIIGAAQEPNGYLMTWITLSDTEEPWTTMDRHEMYCAGHLIEAAIAFKDATGKDSLMDIAVKFADHMVDVFGVGKKSWVTGHPEIELALIKLYRETGNKEYLELSHFLMEERGHGRGVLHREPDYYNDIVPVRDLCEITGHAVRAMYLYTGMADYAATTGEQTYIPALDRLWDDVVNKKMYLTGGIGSSRANEGFTKPYDLPNETAYCETCASIGMVMWNQRLNMLKGESKYIDIMERSLYNAALAGISLSSDRFFYVNPLASAGTHHRKPWYRTACCPSNISRFIPSVGGLIYGTSEDCLWVNLYIDNNAKINVANTDVTVTQETAYPWCGKVTLTLNPEKGREFAVKLRIPGWCKSYTLTLNGKECQYVTENGYAVVEHKWKGSDKLELNMDMPVEVVASDPRVEANVGRRAIMRGPLVYCIEEVDNPEIAKEEAQFSSATTFETAFEEDLLNGVVSITAKTGDKVLKFIPYYAWDNREAGKMEVWLKYNE